MLTLLDGSGGLPLELDDYYYKELASGLDELHFGLSIWDPAYPQIAEEAVILERHEDGACRYRVKAIDAGADRANIKAQIDLDEWKSDMTIAYDSGSNTVGDIVAAVKPAGWSVADNSAMTYKRTIRLDAATPLDVLEQCRSTFTGVTFRFDTENKVCTVVNMNNGSNAGAFVTRELNLSKNEYKGKSTNFVTRLYAYGKDGLSFASINDGKPYVENNTYSASVISAYWKDERYTNAENLMADAQSRLDQMAVPQRSFSCDVVDFAAVDPSKYSYLSFPLFAKVWLIDDTRSSSRVQHTVVERWVYPYLPNKNKVVLSTVAPRIQSQISSVINSITNVNSDWSQQQRVAQAAAIASATADILGAEGGSVRLLDTNNDGEPDTLYIADNPDPTLAIKVWRFNYEGWAASSNGYNGPFTMAATLNSGIVADYITAGVLTAITIRSSSGNFTIDLDSGVLSTSDSVTYAASNYAQADLTRILGIIGGSITPTTADYAKYDFYQDGRITLTDLTIAQRLVNTGEDLTLTWQAKVEPGSRGNAFSVYLNGQLKTKVGVGSVQADMGIFPVLESQTFRASEVNATGQIITPNLTLGGTALTRKVIGYFVSGASGSSRASCFIPAGVTGSYQISSDDWYTSFTIDASGTVTRTGGASVTLTSQAVYNF